MIEQDVANRSSQAVARACAGQGFGVDDRERGGDPESIETPKRWLEDLERRVSRLVIK